MVISGMSQEHPKVLLIEHDAGFAKRVGEMLGQARDLGAELEPAADLSAGISALRRNNFDVVVLDISIPDGAGLANVPLLKVTLWVSALILVGFATYTFTGMPVCVQV